MLGKTVLLVAIIAALFVDDAGAAASCVEQKLTLERCGAEDVVDVSSAKLIDETIKDACKSENDVLACLEKQYAEKKKTLLSCVVDECGKRASEAGDDSLKKKAKAAAEKADRLLNACHYSPDLNFGDDAKSHISATCADKLDSNSCLSKAYADWQASILKQFIVKCEDDDSKEARSAVVEAKERLRPLLLGIDSKLNASTQTPKPWLIHVALGQQYLPVRSSTDSDESDSGFTERRSFLEIVADNRVRSNDVTYHWGAILTMEGQPVATKNEETQPDGPSIDIKGFNDVAKTLTAATYWTQDFEINKECHWFCSNVGTRLDEQKFYDSSWAWGGKLGLRSREKRGNLDDSADGFFEFGLRYAYSEYEGNPGNVLPRGSVAIGYAYWDNYEDYLGGGGAEGRHRLLIRGEYRLSDSLPVYFGIKANTGKGDDNVMLFLDFRFKSEKLLDLFHIGQ